MTPVVANTLEINRYKMLIAGIANASVSTENRPSANFIGWFNRILAEEIKCMMRYRSHYFQTLSNPKQIASIFLIHSNEKLQQVDLIALRIIQLGGTPDFSSDNIPLHGSPGISIGSSLYEMIEENLKAERIAIITLRDMIKKLSGSDFTSSRLLKNILHADERRVEELVNWLEENRKKPYTKL
ncbi:MAG TPA: ferritin-like domain-containing protein [Cellvibrio sp.]|nr:ferritin-like domain-containing protein [Cellvibrio sp.]